MCGGNEGFQFLKVHDFVPDLMQKTCFLARFWCGFGRGIIRFSQQYIRNVNNVNKNNLFYF